jgi:murein L,D-transpeptidase YcbB/YkuD
MIQKPLTTTLHWALLLLLGLSWQMCSKKTNNTSQSGTSEQEDSAANMEGYYNPHIKSFLDSLNIAHHVHDRANSEAIYKELKKFYELKHNQLVWFEEAEPREALSAMHDLLRQSHVHGLDAERYRVQELINDQQSILKRKNVDQQALAELDVQYSIEYISYAWHLHNGRSAAMVPDSLWMKSEEEGSVAPILAETEIDNVEKVLAPSQKRYAATVQALHRYRQILRRGGWPKVQQGLQWSAEEKGKIPVSLLKRLQISGDLSNDVALDTISADKLTAAITAFQKRHGLAADGVLGESTIDAMNMPVQERVNTLMMNLERMRWMPNELGERYILVNIPAFELHVWDEGKEALEMRIIIGETVNKTPVFRDEMEYLVFSPTWRVPPSIAQEEMLPKLQKDARYLSKNNFRLFDSWTDDARRINPDTVPWSEITAENFSYRVEQNPGRTNALGLVKFIMPNSYHIYLHDTPADYLFTKDYRAFSHGCIRLEKPTEMAQFLLDDQPEYTSKKINELMQKSEPVTVPLTQHVPVYLVYRTAWAEQDGTVHFRKDIYGIDKLAEDENYIF